MSTTARRTVLGGILAGGAALAAAPAVEAAEPNPADGAFRAQLAGGVVTPGINILAGDSHNVIASDIGTASIAGGGTVGRENIIGGLDVSTVNTARPNLPATGSGADYSHIAGGYDNMACGLMSVIHGAHNYTKPTSTHGTIGGGSGQKIDSGNYHTIGGGTLNRIDCPSRGTIGGGSNNAVIGSQSTVGGGKSNAAAGASATIAGGETNTTSADSAAIAGGNGNTGSGTASSIGGGSGNTTSGTGSAIPGGYANLASGAMTTATGYQAKAQTYGEHAHAAGMFAKQGDAQVSRMVARRATTDATPTDLRLDGGSQQAIVPTGAVWGVSASVVAKNTATGECSMWQLQGLAKRPTVGGGALVGSASKVLIAQDAAASAWDVSLAVTPAGVVAVKAVGADAATVRWVARVEAVQIA